MRTTLIAVLYVALPFYSLTNTIQSDQASVARPSSIDHFSTASIAVGSSKLSERGISIDGTKTSAGNRPYALTLQEPILYRSNSDSDNAHVNNSHDSQNFSEVTTGSSYIDGLTGSVELNVTTDKALDQMILNDEGNTDKNSIPSRWAREVLRLGDRSKPQSSSGFAHSVSCELRRPIIYGIRCDNNGAVDNNGALVIKANEPTEIILIGHNLDTNISIALTSEVREAQADCTHADRVRTLHFNHLSSNIAHVVINAPPEIDRKPYYLCLRDPTDHWYHQGSEAWLRLYIKEDFLPIYMKVIVIACLLMLSGLFSGLNLGLMALDKNELQVIISCGSDTEKRYARAIEPVRRRGNYLLCSILFSNVLVNSTIAVLLEELTSGIVAVMTSTIFIVMFGEILPQAFCSRHGLAVGAKTVSITYLCMIVTFPLSYPVSCCLDWALGEEIGHAYDRERLMEFIRVTRDYNNLETDEVNIISGALKLKRIPVSEIMTRIEDVFMLDMNSSLDFDTIQAIIEKGYSRIPVHEPGNKKNIVALLFAKDLALLDPDDKTPVQTMINFYNHPIMFVFEDTTLDLALNEFKTGKSHMAFVRRVVDEGDLDPIYEIMGIVTLEDVIEEIMQMEINDETDTVSDNRRKRRRKEAQVRRDFSQFTKLGAGDSSFNVVTPQLCLAAYQYLATTVEPFSARFISDSILKRLLSQKIYYKVRLDDSQKKRRLYTADQPADFFIMILEGRVHVVCGKESLVFESGPFSHFGKNALVMQEKNDSPMITRYGGITSRKQSSTKQPLLGGGEQLRDSLVNWSMNGSLSNSMKKLEQVVNNEMVETSLTVNESPPLTATAGYRLKTSDSRASIHSLEKSKFHIIPDYTVDIVANTSYLKITRAEYMAAMKATYVERGTATEEEVAQTNASPYSEARGDLSEQ